jgi:hypothetical protein
MFDYQQRPETKELDNNWDRIFGVPSEEGLPIPPDSSKIAAKVYGEAFDEFIEIKKER